MKKLIRHFIQKYIESVRKQVQYLEDAVTEQRLLATELNRNCWMSTPVEKALVDVEIALINRRKHLEHLLGLRPSNMTAFRAST